MPAGPALPGGQREGEESSSYSLDQFLGPFYSMRDSTKGDCPSVPAVQRGINHKLEKGRNLGTSSPDTGISLEFANEQSSACPFAQPEDLCGEKCDVSLVL